MSQMDLKLVAQADVGCSWVHFGLNTFNLVEDCSSVAR